MNVPNTITLARLLAVPLVVLAIIAERAEVALWLFVAAGLSDAVDGFIARRFGLQSELGAYLDPVADKALLVSAYVTLAAVGEVPVWLAVAVVARDLMIVGAVLFSWWLAAPVVIRPLLVSKLNTAAQIGFAAFVLAELSFDFAPDPIFGIGLAVVGTLIVLSAAAYLVEWGRHLAAWPVMSRRS